MLTIDEMEDAAKTAAKDAAIGNEGGLRNPHVLGILDHEQVRLKFWEVASTCFK